MEYRAVGNRCAVDLLTLHLTISRKQIFTLLAAKGFRVVEVDLVALARPRVGTARYRRGAKPSEAPMVVDCSSLVKWLYGQRGIWLPRRSIQQRELGKAVPPADVAAGDLLFVAGAVNYSFDDPADGVGHVGLATGEGTVIHAADRDRGVVESPLQKFIGRNRWRGARRYIPQARHIVTLETPPDREVETADDIRWIVLQSLPITGHKR